MVQALTTTKALSRIFQGELIESPVVQVLAYKKVDSTDGSAKYRFILSDGENMHQMCILSGISNLEDRVENGEFERYTIIKLLNYKISEVKGNKVLCVTDLEVVQPGAIVAEKIGNPINIAVTPAAPAPNGNAATPSAPSNSSVSSSPAGKRAREETSRTVNDTSYSSSPPAKKVPLNKKLAICPIKALNSFQRSWTVKGRVTSKSPIRNWSNPKGSGKLFSFDLKDDSGEVRCTGFNQEVDKYYEMLQVGKVYVISRAGIKQANRKYSNINNEFEISLSSDSTIDEGDENDAACPQVQYNFVPIANLEQVPPDTIVDVIGVIKTVQENYDTIVQKRTQKELEKREISILDHSMGQINLTLWGSTARTFEGKVDDIVIVQGARLSDYQKRSLSGGSIYVNLEHDSVDELRNWYTNNKDSLDVKSLTAAGAGAGGQDSKFKLFFQFFEEANRDDKRSIYGVVKVHIVKLIRISDYPACPGENCKKRVLDLNNQFYRCEKCNKDYPNCINRIILSGSCADATASAYFSAFHEEALTMLEKQSVEEVLEYKSDNDERYEELFAPLNFKTALVKVKVTFEVYKEERRSRMNIVGILSMDHGEYTKKLMSAIREFQ